MHTTGTTNNSSVLFDQYYREGEVGWRGDRKAVESLVERLQERPPAGDEALIHALDLAPTGDVPSEEVIALIMDLSETLERLNQNGYSEDELSRMLLKIFQNARFDYMRSRILHLHINKNELLDQAKKTDDEGNEMKRGATATLCLGVVQGAVTVIATGVALKSVQKSFDKIKGADKVAKDSATNLKQLAELKNVKTEREAKEGWTNIIDGQKQHITKADKDTAPQYRKEMNAIERKQGDLEAERIELSMKQQTIINKAQDHNTRSQSVGAIGQGVGGGVGAAGAAGGQYSGAEQAHHRAEGERHAAKATAAQAEEQHQKAAWETMKDMINKIIEFDQRVKAGEADQLAAVAQKV
jgi:hypothetical protein